MSAYEIVALRYATHARPASENFLYPAAAGEDPHDYPMPIDYFGWVFRNGERTVLVDTGFDHPAAAARGRTLLKHPVEGLRALGVNPAAIRDVVITHLHYDHAGNLARFRKPAFICRIPRWHMRQGAACAIRGCATPSKSRMLSRWFAASMPAG